MGKKVIKVDDTPSWLSGRRLEKDERLQTDEEWHGDLLEHINLTLEDINLTLGEINSHLNRPERPEQPIIERTAPTPAWQFVFSWIMIVVLFTLFLLRK